MILTHQILKISADQGRLQPYLLGPIVLMLLLAASLSAQSRTIASLDGAVHELLETRGTIEWVRGEGMSVEGLQAIKLLPDSKEQEMRLALRDVPVTAPKTLSFHLKHLGNRTTGYWLWMEDTESRGAGAASSREITAQPGWNLITIDLTDLPTRDGSRKLAFPELIRRVQIGRRKFNNDPGFILDHFSVSGETTSASDEKAARGHLETKDPAERNTGLLRRLLLLPEDARVQAARFALKTADDPRTRRIVFESLSMLSSKSSVVALRQAADRHRGTERLLWLHALAAMPHEDARTVATEWIANRKSSTQDRCALLVGMARKGFPPDASLDAILAPSGPWQARAALVRALDIAGDKTSVDRLIGILKEPGSRRVEDDAVFALKRWTGHDLGTDAMAWQRWWDVNRDRPETLAERDVKRRGYGTFYGIPMTAGRTTFIIDTSGSMREPIGGGAVEKHLASAPHLKGKEINTRLDLVKEELAHALESLPEDAAVQVIYYGDGATALLKTMEPMKADHRERLIKRVRVLGAGGGTNIHDGLVLAIHEERKPGPLDLERGPDTIILLTDGQPSRGVITHGFTLRDAVLEWNLGRVIRFHTVNVGDRSEAWLRHLAEASGGIAVDLTSSN